MNVMDNVIWNFENVKKIKQVLKIIIFVLYKKYSLTLFRLTYSPFFYKAMTFGKASTIAADTFKHPGSLIGSQDDMSHNLTDD